MKDETMTMTKLYYYHSKRIEEEKQIKIQDLHNCFFEYDNGIFGIFEKENCEHKIFCITCEYKNGTSSISYWSNGNKAIYTEGSIKAFLENEKTAIQISKQEFFDKLDKYKSDLKDYDESN